MAQEAQQYRHKEEAVQRPDVGVQDQFQMKRPPKTYRYDSSLDPALSWDEQRERALGEWLIGLIDRAAKEGEGAVFNPPQEWAGGGVRVGSTTDAVRVLKSISKPFLNWAGKAERHQIDVPTLPLFVHERHSAKAILEGIRYRKAKGLTLDLFANPEFDIRDRLEAYEHKGPWQNRMILGDSLTVMNSLLEYEGLGGQVQMIYIDPPYGVQFGSNFQPFVRKRGVSPNNDVDMTREPETVKAYRDTWELGLHSYLTYLGDRLLLAHDLIHPSGSIFVQIGDKNLHHVRELMEGIFGAENFVVTIPFKKKGGQKGSLMDPVNDYLIWFAKDIEQCQRVYSPIFVKHEIDADTVEIFNYAQLSDGRDMTLKELSDEDGGEIDYRQDPAALFLRHPDVKLFASTELTSGGFRKNQSHLFTYEGRAFDPGLARGNCWKHTAVSTDGTPCGMDRLAAAQRLFAAKDQLRFRRYLSDFGYEELSNWWDGVGGAKDRMYVVQTNTEIVKRCILMTTKPGDLVLDPTCGSGTTGYVAEEWGRRWITIDTSRVPLALARQRLLTATFPYYQLKDNAQGPAGGFVYARRQNNKGEEVGGLVPHITSSTIANDEPPKETTIVDRPERERNITRVSGPFVVEAIIAPLHPIDPVGEGQRTWTDAATHVDRMIEVLRRSKRLQLPGNRELTLTGINRVADAEYLHAEAMEGGNRVAIVFGPVDGAISSTMVYEGAREAHFLKFNQVYFFGFAIQATAREMIDTKQLRIPASYVAVTPDVAMADLLKTTRGSEIFSITGLPDFEVRRARKKGRDGAALHEVELLGLDIFNPQTLETEAVDGQSVPCWMLDTDYDGMCLYATQVFFPKTSAWDNLQKSLKANFEDSVWAHLAGTVSEPFALGERGRIAVKVIDERGNELLRVRGVDE